MADLVWIGRKEGKKLPGSQTVLRLSAIVDSHSSAIVRAGFLGKPQLVPNPGS